jgi:hypothetical protein
MEAIAQETPERPVAISVSDSLWNAVCRVSEGGRVNLDALETLMLEGLPYERLLQGEAVIWRPFDALADESARADRKALVQFTREFSNQGYVTLRSASRLYHDASPNDSPLPTTWFNEAQRSMGTEMLTSDRSTKMYQLLGEISDDGWDRLMGGATLTCGELGIESAVTASLRRETALQTEGLQVSDLLRHPTELFAGEDASSIPVQLEQSSDEKIKIWNDGSPSNHEMWLPLNLQRQVYSSSGFAVDWDGAKYVPRTTREAFDDDNSNYSCQFGGVPKITVKLGLPRKLYVTGHFSGATVPTGRIVSYTELPQAVRDAMWNFVSQSSIEFAQRLKDNQNRQAAGTSTSETSSPKPAP